MTEPQAAIEAYRRGGILVVSVALLVAMLPVGTPGAHASEPPPGLEPAPERLSATDPAQANGLTITNLSIPAIGIDEIVRSGVAMSVINKGPAHWAGTSEPGGPGNVVLAGHRTTRTKPFHNLDSLEPDDLIVFTGMSSDGFPYIATYRVTETLIIDPHDIWITYETGEPIVTLFACHPKGSARKRIAVRGALVATTTLRDLPDAAARITGSMLELAVQSHFRA